MELAQRGSISIDLHFFNFGARRGWMVVMSQLLYPLESDPILILQEAVCAPGPVRRGAKNLVPHRDSVAGPSSPWCVAIPANIELISILGSNSRRVFRRYLCRHAPLLSDSPVRPFQSRHASRRASTMCRMYPYL